MVLCGHYADYNVFTRMGGVNPWDIIKWLLAQLTFFQFYTPDSLRIWGVGTPNGSLWTIPVEIQFYAILPLLFILYFKYRRKYVLYLLFLFSLIFNVFLFDKDNTITEKLLRNTCLPYLYNFLIGSILYLNWNKIRRYLEGKFLIWLILFMAFCCGMDAHPSYYFHSVADFISNILLSLMTIAAAFTLPHCGKVLHGYDLSYGIYIYHMVVVNFFVSNGWLYRVEYVLLVALITLILSILSWCLIEKRALALKNRL